MGRPRNFDEQAVTAAAEQVAAGAEIIDDCVLDLLLVAAVERAPVDTDVAALVAKAWRALEQALHQASLSGGPSSIALSTLLGERLLTRAAGPTGVPS